MEKSTYTELLEELIGQVALFETAEEVDDLLKKALARLMGKNGSSLGAAYIYDDCTGELVFRVGFDNDDFWDRCRCSGCKPPERLALDDNEVGLAFKTGLIKMITYDEPPAGLSLHSKILIPISRGPERVGVFIMAHRDKDAYAREELSDLKKAVLFWGIC